jgi:hypothetical protein
MSSENDLKAEILRRRRERGVEETGEMSVVVQVEREGRLLGVYETALHDKPPPTRRS